MASVCGASINACGLRVTELDSEGNVVGTPNNFWVTSKLIEISVTPEVEEGTDVTMKSGCDCIIATFRAADLLKRFNFTISLGQLEPGLIEMMIGGSVILSGADVIGINWPTGIDCEASPPPKVALEVWSFNQDVDAQNTLYPYWHWVWPGTQWQIGEASLGAGDFFRPQLTGFSFGNANWVHGPYNDDPGDAIEANGAVWATATAPPTAQCEYQTVAATS